MPLLVNTGIEDSPTKGRLGRPHRPGLSDDSKVLALWAQFRGSARGTVGWEHAHTFPLNTPGARALGCFGPGSQLLLSPDVPPAQPCPAAGP